jgi:hypothetical protein
MHRKKCILISVTVADRIHNWYEVEIQLKKNLKNGLSHKARAVLIKMCYFSN